MRALHWALLSSLLIGACGATSQLPPNTAADVRKSRIAAGFYNVDPRIVYEEHAYRVLWMQKNLQEATFANIWDADVELSEVFVAELNDRVVEVIGLHQDEEFAKGIKATIRSQGLGPGAQRKQLVLNAQQLAALRGLRVKYVVLLCGGAFTVQSHTIAGKAYLFVPVELIVYDVTSGKQIYSELTQLAAPVPYRETVREIEVDGMTKLRAISSESLVKGSAVFLPRVLRIETQAADAPP